MKKLAIALAASAVIGVTAVPAGAQGVVIGVDDGYRSGWWGGHYGYRSWRGGPRAEVYVRRDRPHYRYRRHLDHPYGAYGYRSWWGGGY